MVIVTLRMVVLPHKKKELRQALVGLAGAMRSEKGYISHHICQDIDNENVTYVWESWRSRKNLDDHWRSDGFSALLGSAHLLESPIEFEMHAVSHTAGLEAVRLARGA